MLVSSFGLPIYGNPMQVPAPTVSRRPTTANLGSRVPGVESYGHRNDWNTQPQTKRPCLLPLLATAGVDDAVEGDRLLSV